MDFISDRSGRIVNFIAERLNLPEEVKRASFSVADTEQLSRQAFADPIAREFPLHTPEATIWSALYAKTAGRFEGAVQARLKAAATRFDVWPDIEASFELLKTASAQTSEPLYALDIQDAQEKVRHFYPISTREELWDSAKQANLDFVEGRLPGELFRDASQAMVKQAKALDLPAEQVLNTSVLDYGVERMPDPEVGVEALEKRAAETGDEAYQLMANNLRGSTEEARELADLASRLDAHYLAEHPKLAHLMPIHRAIFSGPTLDTMRKTAANYFLLQDQVLPLSALDNLTEEGLNTCLSPDVAGQVMQAKQAAAQSVPDEVDRIFTSLNDDDANSLLRYLASVAAP